MALAGSKADISGLVVNEALETAVVYGLRHRTPWVGVRETTCSPPRVPNR